MSLVLEDGRVTRIHLMRNPQKLTRIDEPAEGAGTPGTLTVPKVGNQVQ